MLLSEPMHISELNKSSMYDVMYICMYLFSCVVLYIGMLVGVKSSLV